MSVAAVLAAACLTLPAPHGSTQLVTVQAQPGSTVASLRLWERRGTCWRRVAGPWEARLGRGGLSTRKREGYGATATGTYPLGASLYGIAPNPAIPVRSARAV